MADIVSRPMYAAILLKRGSVVCETRNRSFYLVMIDTSSSVVRMASGW